MSSAGLAALLALVPPAAEAKKLANVITGLYGGDGITLDDNTHDAHFEATFDEELGELASEIAAAVNLASPGSAVASFTFDLQEAVFVQTTQSLGPTVAERPQTIGQGKINFGFSYTRLDFKRFDGDKLDNLDFKLDHDELAESDPNFPISLDDVLIDLDIDLNQDLFQFFASYGITSNWDVGILVPVVHTDLDVNARATVRTDPSHDVSLDAGNPPRPVHVFCDFDGDDDCEENPIADVSTDSDDGDDWGIGDIVLRTKVHFFDAGDFAEWTPDVGAFGFVKFESGDEDDLAGTGHTNFDFFLTVAKTIWCLTPHVNAGFEFTTGDSELNNFRYIAGADAAIHERVSLSADVVGRTALNRDGFADDIVDFAIGTKVSPWSTLAVIGTVILPLNRNEGLRTDVTWSAGLEYTF